jgi:hypothetical protein
LRQLAVIGKVAVNKLEYQLDILKLEIETINSTIRQMDGMTEKIKNWTIVIWAAATGAAISTPSLNRYIAFTAVIPLAFWFVDGWYRRIQRRFIWRSQEIHKFLNSELLTAAFKAEAIEGFKLFDPAARNAQGTREYEEFISIRRTMRFGSVSIFYAFLISMSFLAWLVWWQTATPR